MLFRGSKVRISCVGVSSREAEQTAVDKTASARSWIDTQPIRGTEAPSCNKSCNKHNKTNPLCDMCWFVWLRSKDMLGNRSRTVASKFVPGSTSIAEEVCSDFG